HEPHMARREPVHRHIAAGLRVLVLVWALMAARKRRRGALQIIGASALVAAAIPAYMHGHIGLAFGLAGLGEAILLLAALRWSNVDLARAAVSTLAVIIFQALLGKWAVALLLKPVTGTAHLVRR